MISMDYCTVIDGKYNIIATALLYKHPHIELCMQIVPPGASLLPERTRICQNIVRDYTDQAHLHYSINPYMYIP